MQKWKNKFDQEIHDLNDELNKIRVRKGYKSEILKHCTIYRLNLTF